MLLQKLLEINLVLDKLIELSKEDIKNIKEANHDALFKNINQKESLSIKFADLKNQIDSILVERNRPIEEIFTPQEEEEFDKFREKLKEFNDLHKRFSRLALSVANFYNTLYKQIHQEMEVSYNETFKNSNLSLKA